MIVLGYDPGGGKKDGRGKSGVAYLSVKDMQLHTAQCTSVSAAMDWFRQKSEDRIPDAIGIDTFLHWSAAEKGWRSVDLLLRRNYPRVKASVQSTNSTAGSMAIQGMALAILARRAWPKIVLNEVHPKILHEELWGSLYRRTRSESDRQERLRCISGLGYQHTGDMTCEDEFDAALCCHATQAGLREAWPNLADSSFTNEEMIYPEPNVLYLWPRSFGDA